MTEATENSAQAVDTQAQIEAILARLKRGDERMERIEVALIDNTRITSEVRQLMEAGRAGFRLLGWVGIAVKWLGVLATGFVALYTAFYVVTHHGDLPPAAGSRGGHP